MGVAHAPQTAPFSCDSGADSRPAAQSAAVADGKLRSGNKIERPSSCSGRCAPCTPRRARVTAGERCSRVLVPPPCSLRSVQEDRKPGKARRADDGQTDEVTAGSDQRRGRTLTRVAASSIESSAPRSTWSRCASSAWYDGADDVVREEVLSSDLDDAGRRPSAGGEDCREVEVVRDDDEAVLARPRQDFGVWRRRRTDGGPVDSLEPVSREPVDPAWRQVHVHEQLHGWRNGTSTSSARQAA
jgi:hypothetical protein